MNAPIQERRSSTSSSPGILRWPGAGRGGGMSSVKSWRMFPMPATQSTPVISLQASQKASPSSSAAMMPSTRGSAARTSPATALATRAGRREKRAGWGGVLKAHPSSPDSPHTVRNQGACSPVPQVLTPSASCRARSRARPRMRLFSASRMESQTSASARNSLADPYQRTVTAMPDEECRPCASTPAPEEPQRSSSVTSRVITQRITR
jgi:hypothetical protein